MKKPRIPPLLSDLVQTSLTLCDGVLFDEHQVCLHCSGKLTGYDAKKRQFAIVMENGKKRVVYVFVKRFLCHDCGRISPASQPFYPGTRIGSPVVDLCITLSKTMPYSRVSSCLEEMGIIVDRWSVRNYGKRELPMIRSVEMFGFMIPFTIVSLSSLVMGSQGGRRIDGRAILAACNYPSQNA